MAERARAGLGRALIFAITPLCAIMKAIRSAIASRPSGVETLPIACEAMSAAFSAAEISSCVGGVPQ